MWFEEAFNKYMACPNTVGSLRTVPARYTTAIFRATRKGKVWKAKTVWVDTSVMVAKDDSTYQLIMKEDKPSRLPSADVPLQFIFSH